MPLTVFCCDPERALHEQLVEECERAWQEHERELDLQREAELNPPTAVQQPDEVCAAVVLDWDAYGTHATLGGKVTLPQYVKVV